MAEEPRSSRPLPGDFVVVVLFVIMLLAPAALALAGRAGADDDFIIHHEMRHAFTAPPVSSGALATGGWERDLERQIADAFPLRRRLIEAYAVSKYRLGDVASPHVIRGRDDWLFYADDERNYEDGTYSPTDAQLAHLAQLYQARAEWCARRGIVYVFALVPNKSEVYAVELPPSVRYVSPTAGARLVALLRARGVHAIDLRAAERAGAAGGEMYSKEETHWNDAGAYVAYREIVAELRGAGVRDAVPPGRLRSRIALEAGDLGRLAGIASAFPDAVVRYDFAQRAHELTPPANSGDPLQGGFIRATFATDDPRLPQAMIFGDSFTIALRRYLSEDFSRTVVMQHAISDAQQFDRAAIAAEKPAVVVQELIERALVYGDRFEP